MTQNVAFILVAGAIALLLIFTVPLNSCSNKEEKSKNKNYNKEHKKILNENISLRKDLNIYYENYTKLRNELVEKELEINHYKRIIQEITEQLGKVLEEHKIKEQNKQTTKFFISIKEYVISKLEKELTLTDSEVYDILYQQTYEYKGKKYELKTFIEHNENNPDIIMECFMTVRDIVYNEVVKQLN